LIDSAYRHGLMRLVLSRQAVNEKDAKGAIVAIR